MSDLKAGEKVTRTASVSRYSTGDYLGTAEVVWADYEAGMQDDTGVIEAGDILSDDDMERLGVEPKTVIWCE